MKKVMSSKDITELTVRNGNFKVHCFADKNEDGTTFPNIYKSNVLDEKKFIDNTLGIEGELILNYVEGCDTELNPLKELIIDAGTDKSNKYSIEEQNLIYEKSDTEQGEYSEDYSEQYS